MMLITNLPLFWHYILQIDQYWSVFDFCETDSESAENLEAEVFNDDHDHARGFAKLSIDWSEIDQ